MAAASLWGSSGGTGIGALALAHLSSLGVLDLAWDRNSLGQSYQNSYKRPLLSKTSFDLANCERLN